MKKNTISFKELDKFNDRNSAVLQGITFPKGFDFKELNELLSNKLGFSNGKKLIGVHRITGNVLGDKGSTDWLLEFDNEEVNFNCIVRLQYGMHLKWTTDFIANRRSDYK